MSEGGHGFASRSTSGDLRVAVDMRLLAARYRTKESNGRNFGGGVEYRAVPRKLANGREASSGLCWITRARGQCPLHCEIDGYGALVADPIRILREVPEHPLWRLEIEAQPAAQGEVLVDQV